MGFLSRKNQQNEDVALPLPELEEPEPTAEPDGPEPPGLPRVLKLDAASEGDTGGDVLAPGADDPGESAEPPQLRPAAHDDPLTVFQDVAYVDPLVERLLARVKDVTADQLLLELREVRLELKGLTAARAEGAAEASAT